MKSILQAACCATTLVICGPGIEGCNDTPKTQNANSDTCSQWNGTWLGNELDSSGVDRGPITFVVDGNQVSVDAARYGAAPESYTMTGTCNDSVVPSQITGTITASNQSAAVGQTFYASYELDLDTRSGRLCGLKPFGQCGCG